MALSQGLDLRQSHALVMTPQLMQAIKLLQLSNLDLAAYVESELERNPLLERATDGGDGSTQEDPGPDGTSPGDAAPTAWTDAAATSEGLKKEHPRRELDDGAGADTDAAASRTNADASEHHSDWGAAGSPRRDNGEYNLEAFASEQPTLADHLAQQLTLATSDPVRRMIGRYL